MKQLLLTGLILFCSLFSGNACLNFYYSVDNKGHLHEADDLQRGFNINFNLKRIEAKLIKLEPKIKKDQDYKILSDYAVLLLKSGKTAIALDILEQLAKHYPDEYQIAANLGTAYELNGMNQKAFEFIQHGMDLNPNSHGGSEWVHLRILKTKLELVEDSLYLRNHSVLNLSEKDKKDSTIREQILIQVRERFPFSPGPNQIMANIFIDLADCFANSASIEFAKVSYRIAGDYFGADDSIVDPKIDEMSMLKRQFSHIKPKRRLEVGDNVRLGRISYNRMLDNNNPNDYQINWDRVLLNADSLLAYVNLERIEDTPEVTEVLEDTISFQKSEEKEMSTADKPDYTIYYILAAILALLAGYLIIKKRSSH